jgi:hypothetical protein
MKRTSILVLILLIIFISGCGGKNPEKNEVVTLSETKTGNEAGTPVVDEDTNNKDGEDHQSEGQNNDEGKDAALSVPSIGGIYLGNTKQQVIQVLGDNYMETVCEEEGYYGEKQVIMEYDSGITVIVGAKTLKVLDVTAQSPNFPTDLGAKVGDSAYSVLEMYRKKYEEFESMYVDGKNIGWFIVDDGIFLIFDFDKDDGMLFNETVDAQSKVELIKLAYIMHFD